MTELFIKPKHLKMLVDIFEKYCPQAEIWAYGSRLDGTAHDASDLDLAVYSFNDDTKNLAELKTILNNSNIPFLIDILEYNSLPDTFKQEIQNNYTQIFPQSN